MPFFKEKKYTRSFVSNRVFRGLIDIVIAFITMILAAQVLLYILSI